MKFFNEIVQIVVEILMVLIMKASLYKINMDNSFLTYFIITLAIYRQFRLASHNLQELGIQLIEAIIAPLIFLDGDG